MESVCSKKVDCLANAGQFDTLTCDCPLKQEEYPLEFPLSATKDNVFSLLSNSVSTPNAGDVPAQSDQKFSLKNLFQMPHDTGARQLQMYIDALPADQRYETLSSLVRKDWRWFCKAAPYLKFPEPKPLEPNKPINIGFRSYRLTIGGTERVVQSLANHFAENPNYHVTIFIDTLWADKIDFPLHQNVTLVPVRRPINWETLMAENPQDLMICPEGYAAESLQNILLLKALGIRILAQEHFNIAFSCPFKNFPQKMAYLPSLYSVCEAFSCLCRTDMREWHAHGVSNAICMLNPPTFPTHSVTPSTLQSKNILWVGRWDARQKRPELAIRTFAEILKKFPEARLIMLGTNDGNYAKHFQQCKRLILNLNIGDSIDIEGFRKDMAPYYSRGAVLLCTSAYEGFSLAVAEAKTFGLPVVSTTIPYLETLKSGCIQVQHANAADLANAVIELLENDEKRMKLGAEARQDILDNFSEEATLKKYDALIAAILAGREAVRDLCAADKQLLDLEQ
jgi:glycosyltransferase involved in cell wall biosynthesis